MFLSLGTALCILSCSECWDIGESGSALFTVCDDCFFVVFGEWPDGAYLLNSPTLCGLVAVIDWIALFDICGIFGFENSLGLPV